MDSNKTPMFLDINNQRVYVNNNVSVISISYTEKKSLVQL